MKKIHFKLALTVATSAVVMLSGVTATNAAGGRPEAKLDANQSSITAGSAFDTEGMYIVRLKDAPIATYDGSIRGYEATSAKAKGERRLNTNSKAARNYEKFLKKQQQDLLGKAGKSFGRQLETKFEFQHAVNGFAVELSAEEAKSLRSMDGVASVDRERMEYLTTDAGPAWIGAPSIWGNKPNSTQGEGVVIAVLDSGINSDHPSFADIGSDGYNHTNPLGSGNYLPGSYCDVSDPSFCNDKLIGAWSFVPGDDNYPVPEDSDGHGSHTASTAAGNVVYGAELVAPTTTASFDISGVAPHASIIAYDVCIDGCPGAALVAAINQVVVDAGNLPNGIASLNYSISGGGNPYNDTVELGFLAAVDAGIYVSASAGNSGPGASTVAHLGPWVSTTAASTHDRQIANSLIDISSDGGPLADLNGSSLTAGYGPATIIHANTTAFDPAGQCLDPFPAGTFNGEIVVCDRGTIARTAKGQNVLAGGAGGYVLANLGQGEGTVADAHFLPAVHLGDSAGAELRDYLAANTNAVATITDYRFDFDPANGDVMAGFSSRGPQLVFDVNKPDVTAPGVNIMGAEADGQAAAPEYQIISGTSMSSPHNAGAGALLTAMHPDWTPQEIKSALMMSSTTANTVKEDGVTPTDPFDLGAGRIDLDAAKQAGLVMNESIENFLAADPSLGGDPSSLNLASMMNSNCVGTCSWTRTVRNPDKSTSHWNVTASGDGFFAVAGVSPEANSDDYNLKLKKGQSGTVTVTADTTLSADGWHFGTVNLDRNLDKGPDLHMPIAVYASKATDANIFTKTVDVDTAQAGDILNYELNITNGPFDGVISVADMQPAGATFVEGSESVTVTNGSTVTPVDISGGELTWSGMLDVAGVEVVSDPFPPAGSPFGFVDLPGIGVPPLGCSTVCDDSSIGLNLPPFEFDGTIYTGVRIGSNGLIVPTTTAAGAFSPANQDLPDVATPNVIAPFWTDLDLDGTNPDDSGAGSMHAATFNGGAFTILHWEGAEEWNVPGPTYTFQIQIGNVGSGYEGIWFVYNDLQGTPGSLTVGAENVTGTSGSNYYYNGDGTFPVTGDLGDLKVSAIPGGSATINFQAEADCSADAIVNEAELSHEDDSERAIAVTLCD